MRETHPGRDGSNRPMMSARPPKAPMVSPPAIYLPSVTRSGFTPKCACKPADMNARGHHLIEDQQHAMLLGGFAKGCDEFAFGRQRAGAALHRLDDDRRKLGRIAWRCRAVIFSMSL